MRKSATTPRGEEEGSQRILEHHSRKGTQLGIESISSGLSQGLSCELRNSLWKACLLILLPERGHRERWRPSTLRCGNKDMGCTTKSFRTGNILGRPTKSLRRRGNQDLWGQTKLPREGLLRPGLTCPRSWGEERREKCVKSKTQPGKRQSVYFPRQNIRAPRAVLREPEIESWREQI